jgi:pimeloyl-ACP methyl ester carboxylesterase
MRYIDQFFFHVTGNPSGHKLVFLHGLMGAASNWRTVSKAFEDRYQILTFDQRGHGRSFHPASGYHPRDFAQDLRLILDDLGWDQIILVGHSMGGRNALEFAVHFTQRVKGLVIEDIGPEANSKAIDRIERLLQLVPTPFTTRDEARKFFETEYPDLISFYPQPRVVAKFFLTNIEEKPSGQWDWRFDKNAIMGALREGRNEDHWDGLRNLRMPVLIVRGENSADLTAETFSRMKATLPTAMAIEIKDAGHWVHFDQPEAFIRALKEFFLTCGFDSVY